MWEKYYLPINVKDKTILDVGAGSGETSLFYLHHGAKHIIAIEADSEAFKLLKQNVPNDKVTAINEPFKLDHLSIPHDLMKMDIEGAEQLLLSFNGQLKNSVIEAHQFGLFNLPELLKRKFPNLQQVSANGQCAILVSREKPEITIPT